MDDALSARAYGLAPIDRALRIPGSIPVRAASVEILSPFATSRGVGRGCTALPAFAPGKSVNGCWTNSVAGKPAGSRPVDLKWRHGLRRAAGGSITRGAWLAVTNAMATPSPAERLRNLDAVLSRTDLAILGYGRRAVEAIYRACPSSIGPVTPAL